MRYLSRYESIENINLIIIDVRLSDCGRSTIVAKRTIESL